MCFTCELKWNPENITCENTWIVKNNFMKINELSYLLKNVTYEK